MELEQDVREDQLRARIAANFALPGELKADDRRLDEIAEDPGNSLGLEAKAFLANISGVYATLRMPYAMASHAILMREHFRIDMLVRTESGLSVEDLFSSPAKMAQIRSETETRFMQHLREPEVRKRTARETLEVMNSYLDAEETSDGAPELLRQALVLCWTAFEVLARDVFVRHLNLNPRAAQTLLNDSSLKRKFDMAKISVSTIAEHDFDLSSKMGSLLASKQDLSDIVSIKDVYGVLFDCKTLRDSLASDDLRLLSKRRNLIVHRCATVDQRYLQETRDMQTENERLQVEMSDVVRHVDSARAAGFHLLEAASKLS